MDIADIERRFNADPKNTLIQIEYCTAYARLGIKRPEGLCAVPWCKTKGRTKIRDRVLCAKHDNTVFRDALSLYPSVLERIHRYYGGESFVQYDYENYKECRDGGSDCCRNDYCRCGKIINIEIKSQDINTFSDFLLDKSSPNILSYCIDRAIRLNLSESPSENWEVVVGGGYYGEEISGIDLLCKSILTEDIRKLESLKSDNERIIFVLENEYGMITDSIRECKGFSIKTITVDKIALSSQMRKLDKDTIKKYESWKTELPIGIYLKDGEKFSLIDGVHRLQAAKNKGLGEVRAIIGWE